MRFDKWLKVSWQGIASIVFLIILVFLVLVLMGTAGFLMRGFQEFQGWMFLTLLVLALPSFLIMLVILIMSLAEVLTSKKTLISKIAWCVAMLLFNLIGLLVYYFHGRESLTD